LGPGTVYADPYGHTLIVMRRLPQTDTRGRLLLAADAQPDHTVARKRYWRGNFLFAHDPGLGSAGFKHFRPVVRTDGQLARLDNDEIVDDPAYADFDLEQDDLGVEGFYDRVDAVLSPRPQDPTRVLQETIDAFDEQVHARIRSVENGEDFVARNNGVVAMPEGAAVFETWGPWEDYATPARDLRLLIGIDVVRGFPKKVARQPERFALPVRRGGAPARCAPASSHPPSTRWRRAHSPTRAAPARPGRGRSPTCWNGPPRSRLPTPRTTASKCAGGHPPRARRP